MKFTFMTRKDFIMNSHKPLLAPLAAALAIACGTAVWAQDDRAPLPPAKQAGDITYVTGGVAYEEVPAFKDAKRDYPLAIEIYERAGSKNQFTADTQVKLIDKEGDVVFDAQADGPYMLVKAPAGQYKMEATLNGRTVTKQVTVNSRGTANPVVVFPQGTD
jgi:hypothetical protein